MANRGFVRHALFGAALPLLLASSAFSGPLNGDSFAFVSGTTAFAATDPNPPNPTLKGTVDWAVFTEANFLAEWGGTGYTPTPGELVYTYQIYVYSADPNPLELSRLSVLIENAADNIGNFNINGGYSPTSESFGGSPQLASFVFTGNEVLPGGHSYGLAFSSPNVPEFLYGTVIDGGNSATVDPLPSPSSTQIPEPSTWLLGCLGVLMFIPMARHRFSARV